MKDIIIGAIVVAIFRALFGFEITIEIGLLAIFIMLRNNGMSL